MLHEATSCPALAPPLISPLVPPPISSVSQSCSSCGVQSEKLLTQCSPVCPSQGADRFRRPPLTDHCPPDFPARLMSHLHRITACCSASAWPREDGAGPSACPPVVARTFCRVTACPARLVRAGPREARASEPVSLLPALSQFRTRPLCTPNPQAECHLSDKHGC